MDAQEQQIEKIRHATIEKNVQELKKLAKEYLLEVAHLEISTVEKIWDILEKEEGIDFIASTHFSLLGTQDTKEQQEVLLVEICPALEAPLSAAARKAKVDKEAFLRTLRPFLMQIRHQILYGKDAQVVDRPFISQPEDLGYKEFKGTIKDEEKMQQIVWKTSMENPLLTHIVFRAKETEEKELQEKIKKQTGVAPGKIFAEYVKVGQSMWEPIFPNALELQLKIHGEVYEIPTVMQSHVAKTMQSVFETLKGKNNRVFWDQCAPSNIDINVLKYYASSADHSPQIRMHTTIAKEYVQEHGITLPCTAVSAPEKFLQDAESEGVAVFVKAMPHAHNYDELFQKAMDGQKAVHYCEYLPLFTFLRVQDHADNIKAQSIYEHHEMDAKDEIIRKGLKGDIDEVLDTLIAHVLYLQEHFKKIEKQVEKAGGHFMVVNKITKLRKKNTTDMKILQEPLLYGCTNATPISFPEGFTSYTPSAYLSYLLHDVGNAFTCFYKLISSNDILNIGNLVMGKETMTTSFITQELIPFLNNRLHIDILQIIEDMKAEKIKEMGLEHL